MMNLDNDSLTIEMGSPDQVFRLYSDYVIYGDYAMPEFVTKDSGARDEFATGYRRDTQQGKPRYDLIPIEPLTRLADLYARGAEKYGEFNWQLGSPFRRTYASLLRHVFAWASGDRSEDHGAAIAWNIFTLMYYEEMIEQGKLSANLNDMGIPLNVDRVTEKNSNK